ncbi:MAG TPA: terminase [Castellaniella sp.]|uniref:terminase n=1 Tax=Castellaniella sp. TaxID=1955812 RepID=UPI002F08A54A
MRKIDPDMMLAQDMGRFYDDPLGFVMYAYDWGHDAALQVVKLEKPWVDRYHSVYGPDAWACEFLDRIGQQVRKNAFDGAAPVMPIREATSSGHGIGKSAITAWLANWIMCTRPHCKGVVTANTSDQLASKTWAEIAKWTKRCIAGHWFTVTTGRGAMRMVHNLYPESWRLDAQTCREENSESFAGLHAASSTPFYIFDEASAVPDAIWDVAEGGMTDGEPMWFVFGNPTRNTGRFFECFNSQRHRWHHQQIDSRQVQITNKTQIQEWVDDYGEDSDFVRVRVRGVFPRASSMQFISREVVDEAMSRAPPAQQTRGHTAVVGVDVARFGDDQSVIRTRIGRDAKTFKPLRYRGLDTMQLAARVVEHVGLLRGAGYHVVVFVDGGGVGGGVVDRLRQLGIDIIEVQFGSKPDNPRKYFNKRAEMWGRMREWMSSGCLDRDEMVATDLTSIEYGFSPTDQIVLEKKETMKKRGLASPDDGDALAITFAQPVPDMTDITPNRDIARRRMNYDPLARQR